MDISETRAVIELGWSQELSVWRSLNIQIEGQAASC